MAAEGLQSRPGPHIATAGGAARNQDQDGAVRLFRVNGVTGIHGWS
jgi:hypothetical protein